MRPSLDCAFDSLEIDRIMLMRPRAMRLAFPAALSAPSLPGIPQCPGIHWKKI